MNASETVSGINKEKKIHRWRQMEAYLDSLTARSHKVAEKLILLKSRFVCSSEKVWLYELILAMKTYILSTSC